MLNSEDLFSSDFIKLTAVKDGFKTKIVDIATWRIFAERFDRWSSGNARCTHSIPHIIHQIWLGGSLPEKYAAWCESWKEQNPAYEYRLWDDKAILSLGEFE